VRTLRQGTELHPPQTCVRDPNRYRSGGRIR
jgi:hypothetical protein